MKIYILIISIFIAVLGLNNTYAIDLSCDVIEINDQSNHPVGFAHPSQNTTPDGQTVVYFRSQAYHPELFRAHEIFAFPVDNPQNVTRISHELSGDEYIADFRFLPDSTHLTYHIASPSNNYESRLYIARLDRLETHHIMTVDPRNSLGWQWHPQFYFDPETDDNWIVLMDENRHLYSFDVNTSYLRTLADYFTLVSRLSPTEPIIYYDDDERQLYAASLDGSQIESTGIVGSINQISPDGKWMLFSSPYEIDRSYQIYATKTDFRSEPQVIYESTTIYSVRQFDFVDGNHVALTIMDTDDRRFDRYLINLETGVSAVYNEPHPMRNLPNAPWKYTSDGKKVIFGSKTGLHIFEVNTVPSDIDHDFPYMIFDHKLNEGESIITYFAESKESRAFQLMSKSLLTNEVIELQSYDEFADYPMYINHYIYFVTDGYAYYHVQHDRFRVKIDGSEKPQHIGALTGYFHLDAEEQFIYFVAANDDIMSIDIKNDNHFSIDKGRILAVDPQKMRDFFYYTNAGTLYLSTFTGQTLPIMSDIAPYPEVHLIRNEGNDNLLLFNHNTIQDQLYYVNCSIH